jgi:peptide/nickel transport system substrate-binding protein
MQNLSRRNFLKAGAAGASLGLLQAYGSGGVAVPTAASAATPGIKRGGTFTFATTAGIQEFSPYNLITGHYPFMRALFNTLARYDATLKPEPELAEKWDISPDGKTLTLKLRQGVKFHSGREFTSADVKHSVDFGQTNEKVIMRALYRMIKQVETPDKYTVIFRFETVTPGIYDILDTLYIIDKETIEDRNKMAIGTGPFKLDKYIPNDRAEFVPFKDYWEVGKPYLDRYVMRVIPDVSSLVLNLEAGAIDCAWRISNLEAERLQGMGGKYVITTGAPGIGSFDLAINVTTEPFKNKKVRQAIAWSIDRERFCRTVMRGFSQPTCLMWPSHSWAHFKDLEGTIGYDLDKARALLKEAGFEKGFQTELLTASKRQFGYGEMAQILQADLKKIGVEARVLDVEVAIYDNRHMVKGDIVMMVHTYGRGNRDPGSLVSGARAWTNGWKEGNWTHFESAEWERWRRELNSTLDMEKRKAAARKLQEIALDECFTIPIAPSLPIFAYASHVKGFGGTMDNSIYIGDMWLDK